MKKDILKVCVLGLVAVTVFTGCQKKEGEVSKIKKNETIDITSNETSNVNVDLKEKVVKIDIDQVDVDKEHFMMFINATNKEGKTVWKIDIGTFAYGTDFHTLTAETGKKYFYYGVDNSLEARDIQTGKVVWEKDIKSTLLAAYIREQDNKVYVESGIGAGYSIEILDINNGKSLLYLESIDSVLGEPEGNMQYDFLPNTMKINGNIITFEVGLNDDGGNYVKKAGYIKVNTENSKVIFERI